MTLSESGGPGCRPAGTVTSRALPVSCRPKLATVEAEAEAGQCSSDRALVPGSWREWTPWSHSGRGQRVARPRS